MKYMLDTNICIYAIKHKPPEVIRNFLKHDPDDMCISSITYGELMHGVEKVNPWNEIALPSRSFYHLLKFYPLMQKRQKSMEEFVPIWNAKVPPSIQWIC